ncbi:MAG: hypothetical protein K8R21_09425, partial [Leptospira sp.]|nr:hypothetical protein [Leptospira sp.]
LTVLRKAVGKFLNARENRETENARKIVYLCIEKKSNPNSQDKSGKTVLSDIALNYKEENKPKAIEAAKMILTNGGDPTIKDSKDNSPAYYAEKTKDPELIELYNKRN